MFVEPRFMKLSQLGGGGVTDRPGRETSCVQETTSISGGLEQISGPRREDEGRPTSEAGHF